jgi:hypothetical protein
MSAPTLALTTVIGFTIYFLFLLITALFAKPATTRNEQCPADPANATGNAQIAMSGSG